MNKIIPIILTSLFGIFLFGCSNKENNPIAEKSFSDEWDSIKFSTNHHDYMRYLLVNTESIHFDSAVTRYFKYEKEYLDTVGRRLWTCHNDCISIFVYKADSIMFEHEPYPIEQLREKSLSLLLNSGSVEELPSMSEVKDNLGQVRTVSNGFFYVSILPDSISGLQQSIIEIKKAIADYKNELCLEWYNKEYALLESNTKESVDNLVKIGFRLDTYIFVDPILNIVEDESEIGFLFRYSVPKYL